MSVLEVERYDEAKNEYGASLGNYVFICDDNGSPMPHVPAIGLAPTSKIDILVLLQDSIKKQASLIPKSSVWSGAIIEPNDIDWLGEVISLELNGRVGVRLINGKTVTVELRNVLLLKPMHEEEMDVHSAGTGSESDESMATGFPFQGPINSLAEIVLANARRLRATNGAGDDGASDASWETQYSDSDDSGSEIIIYETPIERPKHSPANAATMELDNASEDADRVDNSIEMAPSSPPTRQSRSPSPPPMTLDESSPQAGPSSATRDAAWEPFVVLETAPIDHKYFGEAPASSSRARMKKINAEHKALRSSLPGKSLLEFEVDT